MCHFFIFNPKLHTHTHTIQKKIIIKILFAEPGDTNKKAEVRQVQGL